ncbi:hypothetical protein L6250_01025 [Candidatus Parcubacteria bacterium]|nr:hypothetical protein [Candidatus Parcubacteria bacterium]
MILTLIILIIAILFVRRMFLWYWNKTYQQRMIDKAILLCKKEENKD